MYTWNNNTVMLILNFFYFILLFKQYYSETCRPSEHSVGRPRAEIRTRDGHSRGRDTRPPHLLTIFFNEVLWVYHHLLCVDKYILFMSYYYLCTIFRWQDSKYLFIVKWYIGKMEVSSGNILFHSKKGNYKKKRIFLTIAFR